ncbi:MAG: EAL domain-containing response regulator [Stenotrophomonas sp.]|uniref:EAL domain-containing response regulator n=1 Tax=Stenotrophomonas sp. TaxID=69392 RepID=UPI0028AE056A|nr:EAL domain-containing response regulator [Stenotrophomonas sp.]
MNALAQFVSPQPEARMIQNALVVDSNELQHLPMAKVLRQSGVSEVISALDGARAVAALRDRSWDLIVLDLDITDLTGLQVIDLLAERCRNVRLVIVSSQPSRILNAASAYARHRGLAVAAALRKPLKAEQVRNIVAAAVESPTSAHDAAPVKRSAQRFSREELRGALLEQQIQAYFQPQHCAITGVLRGAEILARWHRADGSVLAPAEFLPAMEREGLLESLTSYMLSCAFDCIAAEDSESSLLMAVNVPACIATGVHWAQSVADHAYHAGVDPSRVVIEITEDGGERCNPALAGAVTQLRLRGFNCAIDDFGSGDSSLDRLLQVPFNELKINRSMLVEARDHAHARCLLASTIAMARQMVATVVVEGVETYRDLDMVRSLGCHTTQGYLHARAMPKADYLQYVARQD